MERILSFLKDAGYFFYTTCDGDKPRVRPFGVNMEINGKLYVCMGKQKESYKQTLANPNIELCAVNSERKWIRVRGIAVPDDTEETYKTVFERAPMLSRLYNEETGNVLGIFWIKDGYAEIASMSGEFESFNF